MGEEKKSVAGNSEQKAGSGDGGIIVDIKVSLVEAITNLQRLAPADSEIYRNYEQLKRIVSRQEDRNVLALMARELHEVLNEQIEKMKRSPSDESGTSV